MAWKDSILWLEQSLTSLQKQRVLSQLVNTENNYHLSATKAQWTKREIPTVDQAIPLQDPKLDIEDERRQWEGSHFTY
jgi:hypothetical protein